MLFIIPFNLCNTNFVYTKLKFIFSTSTAGGFYFIVKSESVKFTNTFAFCCFNLGYNSLLCLWSVNKTNFN